MKKITMKKITKIISIFGIVFAFGFITNQEKVSAIVISTSTPPIVEGRQCHGFYTNLQFGDYNKEIVFLREALVKNGVLNNFTDDLNSFNENVYTAVVTFQGKYGIPQTGFVGPLTRGMLNSLYGCVNSVKPIPEVVVSPTSTPTPTILPISSPVVKSINPPTTIAGNPILIRGSGFTSKMQVNILGKTFSTNVSPYYVDPNGSRMSFVLPNISSGTYSLSVVESNTKLNSNYITLSVTSLYPSVSPTYTTSPSYSPTYSPSPTPSVIYKVAPTYSSSPTYTTSPSSSPVPTTTSSPTYTTSPTSTYRPTTTTSPSPSSVSKSVNNGVSMGATILNSIANMFGF